MGHADQRPQEIERFEISTDIAALDGALHQRIDGSPDLIAGTLIQSLGASNQGIECRGDDLLRRDVVDEQ